MNRRASVLLGFTVAVVLLFCSIWYWQSHPYGMVYGMRRGFMGDGMMMGPWMGIGMMLFWVAFISVGFWAVSAVIHRSIGHPSGSDALEVLKQRYARGEIDKNEYEAKRQDLER